MESKKGMILEIENISRASKRVCAIIDNLFIKLIISTYIAIVYIQSLAIVQ